MFVVDDDRGMLRLIEKRLRREGYAVASAASGQEAIDWLLKNKPALMLLDLKLQDIEGRELINHLAGVGRLCPFIVITGQGDERVAVEMMKRGALDYLVKDVQLIEFVPTVVQRSLAQLEKERKLAAAEDALRHEHALVSAILDTAGALIVTLDAEGRIVRFNRACEKLTGYTEEEMRGRPVWGLIPAEERGAVRELFERMLGEEWHTEFENHWLTRDGRRRLITWSNATLRGGDGAVQHIIATGIDISERKRLEAEILNISEAEQQRIGQDLHDGICQQLAGIELMSQVLARSVAKKSRAVSAQAAAIAENIRDVIGHTRMLSRGLCPVVIESEGLMAALEELAASTQSMFKVECRFRCETPVLIQQHTMAVHLYRIAQEAVSNAIRHGRAKRIDIGLVSLPERLSLIVRDDGMGLPDDARKRNGMGLRIMSYRAGMIGGTLAVEKSTEGGTTVVCTVTFPDEAEKGVA